MPDVGASAHSSSRSLPAVLVLALVAALFAALCATQWLAYEFGYHPNLGQPLVPGSRVAYVGFICAGVLLLVASGCLVVFRFGRKFAPMIGLLGVASVGLSFGPVYAPYKVVAWMLSAARAEGFGWVSNHAAIGLGSGFLVALIGLLPLLRSSRRTPSTSAGSARWGTGDELKADGEANSEEDDAPGGEDYLIGRKDGELLHYGGDGHLVTVAPTRSGKGTGAVIPNLLSYRGSVVVNDPKGENWQVTRDYRERKLRHQCVALDPFGIAAGSDGGFNPLDVVDPDSLDWNDDARMIGDMLVVGDPGGDMGSHWNDEAAALLSGLVLYVTAIHDMGHPKRSLTEVRRLLTLPPEEDVDDSEPPKSEPSKPVDPLTGVHGDPNSWEALLKDMQRAGGLVARAANRQLQKPSREAGSVVSSAQRHTHFLDSARMESVLERTTFDVEDLAAGDLSLYLVLPPNRLDTHQAWLRVVLASMILSLTTAGRPPQRRVLFLLDEFAKLGHMKPVADAVSLMAGYGLTLWMFVQDLGQLKGHYDESWQTFLGNADVWQTFGTRDEETQEYFSKAAGQQTIFQQSTTRNKGKSGSNVQSGEGSSIAETGRRLVMPDEIRRMPISKQLLFVGNLDPIYCDKLFYLKDEEFTDEEGQPLYGENALHASDRAGVQ